MKNLNQESQYPGCDLNLGPSEYEQWCHPFLPVCIITFEVLSICHWSPYSWKLWRHQNTGISIHSCDYVWDL